MADAYTKEQRRANNEFWRFERRRKRIRYRKDYYARLRRRVCAECSDSPEEGKRRCAKCLAKNKAAVQSRQKRLMEQGLCIGCTRIKDKYGHSDRYRRHVKTGSSYCELCKKRKRQTRSEGNGRG